MRTHSARYMAVAAAVPALLLGNFGIGGAQAQATDPPQSEEAPADAPGLVDACQRHMDRMAPQMESMMESMEGMDKMGDMMQHGGMGSMMGGATNSMMGSA